jgi:hypothetical protein
MSDNLLCEVPIINNRDDLKKHLRDMYIISDYTKDYESYEKLQDQLTNVIRGSFDIQVCREWPVKFKFYKDEKETHTLQLRHFFINIALWKPFVELHDFKVLNKDFIIDCENDIPRIDNYINRKLILTLRDYHLKSETINYALSNVLHSLRKISGDFSVIMGLNFSAFTFIDMYNNLDGVKELMECTFDDSLQPHEIEELLQTYEDRLIGILTNEPDNPLGVLLRANSGVKKKQLREFTISEGFKPTLDGKTIPVIINNSTLLRGLDRPSYLFTDATGARKSLVLNKTVMGKAGYFGKIVLMLARTLSINTDISDCGSKHLVTYEVKNKKYLKKLHGKYYKLNPEDDLKVLDAEKDKDLIGKSIMVRSAVTCLCGDKVCPRCIGITANVNKDISDGFSAFESEEITKVVNQGILSAKHLLTTNSEVIEFTPEFFQFFNITAGEITPFINDNPFVENIDDYAIYIDPEDIRKEEEFDEDSLYNTSIYNGRFYVRNLADPSLPDIEIRTSNEKEIYISEETLELMNKKNVIKFSDLNDDMKLFEVVITNNELTRPLYELMDLINSNKKNNSDESIDENIDTMCNKFLDLLIEANIDANMVAAEIIVNRLIRDIINPYVRPDFSQPEMPPYEIYTVKKALKKNMSPLISLSFEDLKGQILSEDIFTIRNNTSYIDPFYQTKISTANLKRYADIVNDPKYKP